MTEKIILAYFHRPDDAQNAEKDLQALGVEVTKIQEVSVYSGDGVENIIDPRKSHFQSLANLTLGVDSVDRNEGILMSADVSASGMSDGRQGWMMDPNILLTAVVDESIHKEALQIVENYGGIV